MAAHRSTSVSVLLLIGLLASIGHPALAVAEATTRTCAAKWAQYLDGTVIAAIQIKRGGKLCEDETATVVDQTLRYTMNCNGEEFALTVLLQHPVDEARVSVKREPGALVVVTLQKLTTSVWWSSLAQHPEKFKTLLSRWPQRGDSEPDPEELEEMAAATVDAASGGATKRPSKKDQAEAAKKEAVREQALADLEEALPKAREELESRKVTPQTIARFKGLEQVLPDQGPQILTVLGNLQIANGGTQEGQASLRRAIKQCKGKKADMCRGAHQLLARSITRDNTATDAATVSEAVKLLKTGSRLIPDDYETRYQLGRHLNMMPAGKVPVGGKKDTAAAAFRAAAALRPERAEAVQMLALRLATAARKKTRATARKMAARALKLEPTSAMGYVALGNTLAMQEATHKLPKATRDKAVKTMRTALELSASATANEFARRGSAPGSGDGDGGPPPLSPARYAETQYAMGQLLSIDDARGAMELFLAAQTLIPTEAKYGEAVQQLRDGAEEYRRAQREKAADEERARLKQMEDDEDAAWEEEGLAF